MSKPIEKKYVKKLKSTKLNANITLAQTTAIT